MKNISFDNFNKILKLDIMRRQKGGESNLNKDFLAIIPTVITNNDITLS